MKKSCKHLQLDDDSLMISLVDSQFHDPIGRKLKHPPFHVAFGVCRVSAWRVAIPPSKLPRRVARANLGRLLLRRIVDMGVSPNRGTPKWMVYDG